MTMANLGGFERVTAGQQGRARRLAACRTSRSSAAGVPGYEAQRLVLDPIDDLDPVRLLAHRTLLDVRQFAAPWVDRMDGQAR